MIKLACIAAAGFALIASVPASATTFYSYVDNGSGTFGHADIDTGSFSDTINIQTLSAGFESVDLSFFADGVTGLSATFDGQPIIFTPQAGNSFHGSLTSAVLQGSQTLMVSGVSDGTGSYAGNVTFGAVPEPASWGLMLLGFGAIGLSTRRTRSAHRRTAASA